MTDDEAANARSPSAWHILPREMADALWLDHQWRRLDSPQAEFVLAGGVDPPDGSVIGTQSMAADPRPGGTPDLSEMDGEHDGRTPSTPLVPVARRAVVLTRNDGTSSTDLPLRPAMDPAIARALRPVQQSVSSRHEQVLDEVATAEYALLDRRWPPVLVPALERRFNVVLVVDGNPSMALWQSTVREFADVLTRQGAFQNVQVRLLCRDGAGFTLRGTASGAPRHSTAELLDPTGRRIVLVLTDGVAKYWRSEAVLPVLWRWGRSLPVAVVDIVPWNLWRQTGMRVHPLRVRAPGIGVPNGRLHWRPRSVAASALYEDVADLMPIPVLGLGARWLGPWAGLVAGASSPWIDVPAVLAGPAVDDAVERRCEPDVCVQEFQSAVGPIVFKLATRLAAVPLDFGIMARIQEGLSSAERAHLAVILASDLVEQIEPIRADSVRISFDFRPGVRQHLLGAGRRPDTADAMRLVERSLGHLVPEARGFGRDLDDEPMESPDLALTPLGERFQQVKMTALRAMSGNHHIGAQRLRDQLLLSPQPQIDPPIGQQSSPFGRGVTRPARSPWDNRGQTGTSKQVRSRPAAAVYTEGVEVPTPNTGLEGRARPGTAPVIWGGVPPRNTNFTGREELLQKLDDRLEPGATTAVVPQALHGLGGVGKSQLAVEYAYRHRADFDVIWWIPAELPVQIQSSLVELGNRLELVDSSEANVMVDVVMDALRGSARGGRQMPANWLLIFDNAEDPEAVLPYLPTGGPGRILVTSRNSQWVELARQIEVDVFRREESIELLQRRGRDLSGDDADQLAEALGDLPLAIEQAAAWRAQTGMPVHEYIELLKEKQAEMLNLPGPVDYQKSVAAAWNLSLDRLGANNPAALRILQVCAFFAPEPIPRSMFNNARGVSAVPDLDRALNDRLQLGQAVRDISRYALARIDHRTNSIQMHRLVQAVLISQMTADEQNVMRHAAHLLLAANPPQAPDNDDEWPRFGQLYPHVIATNAIECEEPGVRELVFNLTKYLYHWGDHGASRDLAQRVYDIWAARLGTDDPDTLRVGRWLGFMLWVVGEYKQAAAFDNELLETHLRVFGDAHEYTADAINSVTGDRRAEGDFAGALELTQRNHRQSLERFGENDPLTLNAAHNLGVSLRLSGRFSEALELDDRTWRSKVDAYGSDHTESLLTQVGLTLDRRELGDYLGASTEHDEVVARYRALMGPLHHHTLRAIRLQAGMRRKAGDHEGAVQAADEAYEGLRSRYGDDHPETIAAALSRSINFRLSGDLDDAHNTASDVARRYERRLGSDHPHTLSGRTCLAVNIRLLGQVEEARHINQEALATFRDRLGEDHPSTIVVAINLASDLFALGEFAAAHELDVATVERAERLLGADHLTTLAAKANLAQDLHALGHEKEGNALRTEVVSKTATRLGNTHPAVAEFANPDLRANCDIDPMPL